MGKLIKPKIHLRGEWGALPPEGVSRYNRPLPEVYYRMTLHHGTNVVDNPRKVAATLRAYQDQHMNVNGWADIGYHYLIDRWGRIWAGRSLNSPGAHVAGANTGNLGICFLFDGRIESLTFAAYEAAVSLAAWYCSYLNINTDEIHGHRDYLATECPGGLIYGQIVGIRAQVKTRI